ncbi:MAG: nucleotidyltransferase family protein [candidate division KSB1 bacterium]|nr:nucleotidyltransferase family protein [candidate division KSB1 bacterium]
MKAIVLAAGYATRLYPLTKDRPKPLLRVGEKTILDYLLKGFNQIPVLDRVYIVSNARFASIFAEWARIVNQSDRHPGFQVEVLNDGSLDNESRLGAIADVQFAIDQAGIEEDCIVAAGDNIFRFDFKDLHETFQSHDADTIVVQELKDRERLKQRGVVSFDANCKITLFEEKPQKPQSTYVCPALYMHKQSTLPLYKVFLNDHTTADAPGHFISWLYQQTPVYAYVMSRPALDIGTLAVYKEIQKKYSI